MVGVDQRESACHAARWAAAVADRWQAQLHIVHALPDEGPNLSEASALKAAHAQPPASSSRGGVHPCAQSQ